MKEPVEYQIVLATYNGALYLGEQLESISQQLSKGQVLVHDDGSTDMTPELLRRWALKESRQELIEAPPTGGASANFSLLLSYSAAPYVFCADQDDVWLPNKLERLLKVMRFYEGVYGEQTPLVVHSDLRLINVEGRELARSFWQYQNLNPRWGDRFNLLLTQNVVTGCTMVVNRALLDKALPVPSEAAMHDWWLALVACAFGKVVWVDEPTVLYRQHGSNEVGAKQFNGRYLLLKLMKLGDRMAARTSLRITAAQAAAFADRFPDSPEAVRARLFARLPAMTPGQRRRTILQQRFFKIGTIRNLAWLGLT